jgi:hypothetical protein
MRTIVVFALFSIAAAPPPDWVKTGGTAARYPAQKFLTGFGEAATAESAKLAATADLAKKISVRIEQNVRDLSAEKNGQYRYEISAATAASTDVRLTNTSFEVFADGGKNFALAYLDRGRFASDRRAERDRAIAELLRCVESAKTSLAANMACRKHVVVATEHGSNVRALDGGKDDPKDKELIDASRALDDRIAELFKKAAASAGEAADTMALELKEQGLGAVGQLTVAPLTYGTSSFTSAFGRQMAVELERAIGAAAAKSTGAKRSIVVRGTFTDPGDRVRLIVTARDGASGEIIGGAQASLAKSSVAKGTELVPPNFKDALAQEKVLGGGEIISGKLRLELSTNKGERNLLFAAGEELKLYMRVNQPAYVRIIYLLASGAKVPIEQAYYLDATKVNQTVEYPNAFEISPPFGVEQIFAVAFTEKPDPLPTTKQTIGGEEYDVVSEVATLVKHRGLKKKNKGLETAEAVISMTTTPK